MPIDGTPAHAFFPTVGMFSSLTLVLRWAHFKDRLTATPLGHNNIREPVSQPSRRIRCRAHSPSRTAIGASRSRIALWMNACSIATVAAIGLTALSLVFAAPAAATGPHGTDGTGHHTATGATQEPADGAEGSTPQSDTAEDPAADPPVGELPTGSDPGPTAGHDKCKRPKGNRGLPPWCTDPASGWMGSTTIEPKPALPRHKASATPAAFILRRTAVQYSRRYPPMDNRSGLNDHAASRLTSDCLVRHTALRQPGI